MQIPIKTEREIRIAKLIALRKKGINPFPAKANKKQSIDEIHSQFNTLKRKQSTVNIAGRLRSLRHHGNLIFAHLQDASGKIQIAVSKKEIGTKNYVIFSDFIDVGDFIEIAGICFVTKKGEKSIMVKKWKILTKAIRPLPEKWHGFQNVEERLRKRYLDILMNPEIRDIFEKKAIFWQSVRDFLIQKGFLEVETPILENTTGGADARPFITHHNALGIDVYLRISMGELWQKRLMVAGFEKTFEIGRQFRNEGMDSEHLQDYTQMEFYWAYADYKDGMRLVKELLRYVAKKTFGTFRFKIKNFTIDLGKKWKIYDYRDIVKKNTGIDIFSTNLKEIKAKLQELNINYEKKGFNMARAMDNLWKYCRKNISGPGFLTGIPIEISPLAKRDETNPNITQRFQVIIAGSELGNGYSELNDPIDQAKRFQKQAKLREKGDEEAHMYDYDFVEALEYGMPPTCGFGMSERVFSFFMNKTIRECQLFPLMRPKSKVNK